MGQSTTPKVQNWNVDVKFCPKLTPYLILFRPLLRTSFLQIRKRSFTKLFLSPRFFPSEWPLFMATCLNTLCCERPIRYSYCIYTYAYTAGKSGDLSSYLPWNVVFQGKLWNLQGFAPLCNYMEKADFYTLRLRPPMGCSGIVAWYFLQKSEKLRCVFLVITLLMLQNRGYGALNGLISHRVVHKTCIF